MTVEVGQIGELILDPRAIAKQFVAAALVNLNTARERDHEEWLADQEAMRRLERSAASKRGWIGRKRKPAPQAATLADFSCHFH